MSLMHMFRHKRVKTYGGWYGILGPYDLRPSSTTLSIEALSIADMLGADEIFLFLGQPNNLSHMWSIFIRVYCHIVGRQVP